MRQNKLIGSILSVMVVIIMAITVYNNYRYIAIRNIDSEISNVQEVTNLASVVSQLNYNAQLEVWEYTYDPTPEKLVDLQGDKKELEDSLNELMKMVKQNSYNDHASNDLFYEITNESTQKITSIINDFKRIDKNWVTLFSTLNEMDNLRTEGLISEGEKKLRPIYCPARKI